MYIFILFLNIDAPKQGLHLRDMSLCKVIQHNNNNINNYHHHNHNNYNHNQNRNEKEHFFFKLQSVR